jgi:succinate dehydrogenase/fumarate reductase iron-sulfur protein
MSQERWTITLQVARCQPGAAPRTQSYKIEVDPDENVLDAVERTWAFQDRSLVFRHACHHSTCGACGMRVNGVEKLTCITPIRSVTADGGTLRLEPLRNFPIAADLAVDMTPFYRALEEAGQMPVVPVAGSALPYENEQALFAQDGLPHERLADCIECGMCVSACPVALTTSTYAGPAALAAAQVAFAVGGDPARLDWADSADGAWRCHSGFECSAVCPSNVDPAWRIMDLRRRILRRRIRQIFGLESRDGQRNG